MTQKKGRLTYQRQKQVGRRCEKEARGLGISAYKNIFKSQNLKAGGFSFLSNIGLSSVPESSDLC